MMGSNVGNSQRDHERRHKIKQGGALSTAHYVEKNNYTGGEITPRVPQAEKKFLGVPRFYFIGHLAAEYGEV